MRPIPLDTTYTSAMTVADTHTATTLGSGDLPVLGTPAMAALMENAAMKAIAPLLDPGESSVGVALHLTHDRASAVGEQIRATATVTAVEGRRIEFRIEATDASGEKLLGRGTHTRFVVEAEKFMNKIGK